LKPNFFLFLLIVFFFDFVELNKLPETNNVHVPEFRLGSSIPVIVSELPFLALGLVDVRRGASEPSGLVLDTSLLIGDAPLTLRLLQLQLGSFGSWNVALFQQTLIRSESAVG
jgi:hypothetical protein